MHLRPCGCIYGACICREPKPVPQSDRLKSEMQNILGRFKSIEYENVSLNKEVVALRKLAEQKYETVVTAAQKDAAKIIREAEKEAKKIRDQAFDKAETLKTLREGIRTRKVKQSFWLWLINILPEIDQDEIEPIVRDELEHAYKIKV